MGEEYELKQNKTQEVLDIKQGKMSSVGKESTTQETDVDVCYVPQ